MVCNYWFNITISISSAYDVRLLGEKKMRLVDADELVKICRKGWKLFGFSDEKICHWVDEYDINAQPTIKAIPVEWIEKKLYCCDNINAEIFVKALIREWENTEWQQ